MEVALLVVVLVVVEEGEGEVGAADEEEEGVSCSGWAEVVAWMKEEEVPVSSWLGVLGVLAGWLSVVAVRVDVSSAAVEVCGSEVAVMDKVSVMRDVEILDCGALVERSVGNGNAAMTSWELDGFSSILFISTGINETIGAEDGDGEEREEVVRVEVVVELELVIVSVIVEDACEDELRSEAEDEDDVGLDVLDVVEVGMEMPSAAVVTSNNGDSATESNVG